IDVHRAVDLMSVRKSERDDFEYAIKRLQPGNFYGFGDAIALDRTLFHVGECLTRHPEPGEPSSMVPPLPEKMKAILPQLADLPKEAETKARTEKELRAEIRRLEGEVTKARAAAARPALPAPKLPPPPKPIVVPKTEIVNVEVPVIKPAEMKRLESIIVRADAMLSKATEIGLPFETAARDLRATIASVVTVAAKSMQAAKTAQATKAQIPPRVPLAKPTPAPKPAKAAPPPPPPSDQAASEFKPSK